MNCNDHMQLCMTKVDTKAVMMVRMKLPSFSALGIRKNFIIGCCCFF